MLVRPFRWSLAALALAGVASFNAPAEAATSGANGTHDPSRIVESNGKFYFCGTGGGCAQSTDGLVWKQTGLRIQIPSWASTYTNVGSYSGNQGIWAPDIVFYNDQYYLYYSFCAQPAAHAPCTIGLYTTPTLDSTASDFHLTDVGKVVNNPPNTGVYQYSAIDPAPFVDATGDLWSAWGSGYGKDTSKQQIFVTRMGTNGLPLAGDPGYLPPEVQGYGVQTGGIEGSYVHYHAGYYYLFWNSGGCCSGASSTYTVHIARSATVSGPYTGSKVWYSSSGSIHGPGHVGIYSACGVERFTYHYYPDSGGSVLGENELSWGADGWPVAGAPSTKALTPCGIPGGGSAGGDGGGASGAGGGNSAGGNPSAGGAGGASSGAGSPQTGGVAGAGSAGAPAAQAGGNPSSAGSTSAGAPASSGAAGEPPPSDPSSDSGCACSLPSKTDDHRSLRMLVVAASILFACLRRRRLA